MERLVQLGATEFVVKRCAPTYRDGVRIPLWQGLVKFQNAKLPWGVGIAEDPITAMSAAISSGLQLMEK